MIVDVEYEDGDVMIAKIVKELNDTYEVRVLLEDTTNGLYYFNEETEIVPKESISGFYDVENLDDTGLYVQVDDKYYELGDDEDYIPTDSETDSDSSNVSLDDET